MGRMVNLNAEYMNAVVVHAPMQFGVEAVPIPKVPSGGLLLKVEAVGLCGSISPDAASAG